MNQNFTQKGVNKQIKQGKMHTNLNFAQIPVARAERRIEEVSKKKQREALFIFVFPRYVYIMMN
jgi:hypothetical protein